MRLDTDSLNLVFREARSQNAWTAKAVPEELIHELYELARFGPTCANSNPARFLFVSSENAKKKLATMCTPGNVDKVLSAPVVTIIGFDTQFHKDLPRLFAHNPGMVDLYANNDVLSATTALRNSSLQGAYLMLAARSLGLDCGPMSGFDNAAVDEHYFNDTSVQSNFICAIGYGDSSALFGRLPRLAFDEACEIL